ncbi:MAG: choice-of-anchor D domain-containing protein, partial [Deltaproteobacteria bacterium]|nr:choice-of-anchor D domain-containing protein [Deltaproteobacteria bacterium]
TSSDTAKIEINTNDPHSPIFSIPMTGATWGSVGPAIGVPKEVDFGSVLLNESKDMDLEISNTGNVKLTIQSASSDNGSFSSAGEIQIIEPGETATLLVVFSPIQEGTEKGILTLSSDDPLNPAIQVNLSGYGEKPPEGPISMDFNLSPGDQQKRIAGNGYSGREMELQLQIEDELVISGWRATILFDPDQIRYTNGSFKIGDEVIGHFAPSVEEERGKITVGGSVGDETLQVDFGTLGNISFEIMSAFGDSTMLVISQIVLEGIDGVKDERSVYSTATITRRAQSGIITGDFDGNEAVDFDDFFLFADAFGKSDQVYDLNNSGLVDFDDFFLFADSFGRKKEIDPPFDYSNPELIVGDFLIDSQESLKELTSSIDGPFSISGNLSITNSSLANLEGLNNLASIEGRLTIERNNSLRNLHGLDNLRSINDLLRISDNRSLETIDALSNLSPNFLDLSIYKNDSLKNLRGLENVQILLNINLIRTALISLEGLDNLTEIRGNLNIQENENLPNLKGLDKLNSIGGPLFIRTNSALSSVEGFAVLFSIGGLVIDGNRSLTDLNAFPSLAIVRGDVAVTNNSSLPTQTAEGFVERLIFDGFTGESTVEGNQ